MLIYFVPWALLLLQFKKKNKHPLLWMIIEFSHLGIAVSEMCDYLMHVRQKCCFLLSGKLTGWLVCQITASQVSFSWYTGRQHSRIGTDYTCMPATDWKKIFNSIYLCFECLTYAVSIYHYQWDFNMGLMGTQPKKLTGKKKNHTYSN